MVGTKTSMHCNLFIALCVVLARRGLQDFTLKMFKILCGFFFHNCNNFFIFLNFLPRLGRYSSHNSSLSQKSLLGGSGKLQLENWKIAK